MSSFNQKRIEAMLTQNYICPKCGCKMEWEDEWEETLVCPDCGHSMDSERYGFDEDENLYPTLEELMEDPDEEDTELYEEVFNELEE